jgi:hypothetical protein
MGTVLFCEDRKRKDPWLQRVIRQQNLSPDELHELSEETEP